MTTPSPPPPLPAGFGIAWDRATRMLAGGIVAGGSPARIMRLTATGHAAWRELSEGPVVTRAAGALARRLTDAGAAHPVPPVMACAGDVTVVIPARDRPALLERCLSALGHSHPVIVVDDGSADPRAVAEVACRHGASLVRRAVSGGPGAARNTALDSVASELVAFLDSDCVPDGSWVSHLAAHFADPAVGAAAPRITGLAPGTWAGRYTTANGSLDLGERPARVAPGTRVSFVPTAALVARRDALLAVARAGQVFDPALRTGEDVDLVWRLAAAGWRIRYDPSVTVAHHEPATWTGLLARRFRYGTSAAPLALRHPRAVPPLVIHPWPALTVAALLARRPVAAAAAFGISITATRRALRQARVRPRSTPRVMLTAVGRTWLGAGRYGTWFGAPLLIAAIGRPGGRTPATRWGRRMAAVSLLLGPPVTTWAARHPSLDPARFVLGHLADDIAYGSGVVTGCLTHHTSIPIRPVIVWHPLRARAGGRDASATSQGTADARRMVRIGR